MTEMHTEQEETMALVAEDMIANGRFSERTVVGPGILALLEQVTELKKKVERLGAIRVDPSSRERRLERAASSSQSLVKELRERLTAWADEIEPGHQWKNFPVTPDEIRSKRDMWLPQNEGVRP